MIGLGPIQSQQYIHNVDFEEAEDVVMGENSSNEDMNAEKDVTLLEVGRILRNFRDKVSGLANILIEHWGKSGGEFYVTSAEMARDLISKSTETIDALEQNIQSIKVPT